MSAIDPREADLHAYCDGELGWWHRRRFEAALRRSPELRAELADVRALGSAIRESEAEAVSHSPGLWAGIEGQLRTVDAAREISADAAPGGSPFVWPWGSIATGAVAAGVAAAAFFALQPGGPVAPGEPAVSVGAVRYLDTGGAPVLVNDSEGLTIIWLMESGGDSV